MHLSAPATLEQSITPESSPPPPPPRPCHLPGAPCRCPRRPPTAGRPTRLSRDLPSPPWPRVFRDRGLWNRVRAAFVSGDAVFPILLSVAASSSRGIVRCWQRVQWGDGRPPRELSLTTAVMCAVHTERGRVLRCRVSSDAAGMRAGRVWARGVPAPTGPCSASPGASVTALNCVSPVPQGILQAPMCLAVYFFIFSQEGQSWLFSLVSVGTVLTVDAPCSHVSWVLRMRAMMPPHTSV